MAEQFVFFWGGPFSNWYMCKFMVDGIVYNCTEQHMMASKARYFNDKESEIAIMEEDLPREQKALGRKVKNFDADKWSKVAKTFVIQGCYAKFDQNPYLKKELLDTGDATLVEASPYDKIWGVGLRASDPRINDRANWLGTNWLGEVLVNVRELIKCDSKGLI